MKMVVSIGRRPVMPANLWRHGPATSSPTPERQGGMVAAAPLRVARPYTSKVKSGQCQDTPSICIVSSATNRWSGLWRELEAVVE
jgi:hypothetical protein